METTEIMATRERVQYKEWDCELQRLEYANKRVALTLVAWADNEETDIFQGEPIATATVNLPLEKIEFDEVLVKDYAENQGMLQALIDANIIEKPHREIRTGFVHCPVCKLKSI